MTENNVDEKSNQEKPENNVDEKSNHEKLAFYAKVFQGFFLALFFLGVSTGVGDLAPMLEIPLSSFSMSTMTYGLLGMLGCEFIARRFSG